MPEDLIDSQAVLSASWLSQIDWLPEVDSTNRFAASTPLISQSLPWLIGTDTQTAGRGRGTNSWWSSGGALTFSIVLAPEVFGISPLLFPVMSLATGLAVRATIDEWLAGKLVEVKWPNDIYVQGCKISGLLIESHPDGENRLIVGIGINVNNSLSTSPDEVRSRATSIVDLQDELVSRTHFLIDLLRNLKRFWLRTASSADDILSEYRDHCYLSGRQILIDDGVQEALGVCHGIDESGALQVCLATGMQRFFAGTIQVIGS